MFREKNIFPLLPRYYGYLISPPPLRVSVITGVDCKCKTQQQEQEQQRQELIEIETNLQSVA